MVPGTRSNNEADSLLQLQPALFVYEFVFGDTTPNLLATTNTPSYSSVVCCLSLTLATKLSHVLLLHHVDMTTVCILSTWYEGQQEPFKLA